MKFSELKIFIDGLGKGGAETLLLSMLPSLKKEFELVRIYYLKKKGPFVDDFRLFADIHSISIWGMIMLLLRIRRSIVICHLYKPILLVNIFLFFFRNQSNHFFCHEHSSSEYYKKRPGIKKLFGWLYLNLITHNLKRARMHYIVSSEKARKIYLDIGVSPANLILFQNSFLKSDIDQLKKSRKSVRHKKTSRNIRCFTLCRLDEIKQLDWAILSLSTIAKKMPECNFFLSICGDGPDKKRLRNIISNEIQRITNLEISLEGYVVSAIKYLSKNDLYLLPSKVEGFPLSLTEAAISGIPCITTPSSPAIPELVNYFPNITVSREISFNSFNETVEGKIVELVKGVNYSKKLRVQPWRSIEENSSKLLQKINFITKR